MRQGGRERNPNIQVEGLVRMLLGPLGRMQRQKLLGLLGK
jgi:hypothetical protein